MTGRVTLALMLALCTGSLAHATETARKGPGFSIQPPPGWQVQQPGPMGAALMARPARDRDAEGWGQDLLLVTTEPYDPARTCLDGFLLRKLQDMGHLATHFQVVDESPLTLGKAPATRVELRYAEGSREMSAYLLVMAHAGRMISVSLASDPRRFEFNRALFRRSVESLRPENTPSSP